MSFRFYTTTIFILTAFGLFGVALFYTPQVAEAQSCRTENVGSVNLTSSSSVNSGGSDSNSVTDSISFSSYTSGGEYVSKVVFSGDLDTGSDSECDGGGAICNLLSRTKVSVGGGAESEQIEISSNGGSSQSKDQVVTLNLSSGHGYSSADFIAYTDINSSDDPNFPGFGSPQLEADAVLSDVSLEICSTSNSPPTANDDGTSIDRICIQEGSTTNINVLANDSDPDGDSISIDSFPTAPSRGVVNLTIEDGVQVAAYTPSSTGDDYFTYQISDSNGATDMAAVYIENTSGCGQVTADIVSDGSTLSGATAAPYYDGTRLVELPAGDASGSGWNVQLDETPRLFEIRQEDVTLPPGYEFPETGWIQKFVEYERTGQENTAELGVSHSTGLTPGSCEPDPDPSVNNAPTADAFWNLNEKVESGGTPTYRINLSGAGSDDPEDCDALSYQWEVTNVYGSDSLPAYSILEPEEEITMFEIYDDPGGSPPSYVTYDIRLTVEDPEGLSDTDDISITLRCEMTMDGEECNLE